MSKTKEQKEEEKKREIQAEITACRQLLAQSDYQCLKFAEGQLTEEEYEPIKTKRQELRDKINELEAEK
ncbi:MAG: hypothetical protein LUD72_11385 [Bacteroidales bacterium]|nr:hypothetical protein [Bacteroidales bacterium]